MSTILLLPNKAIVHARTVRPGSSVAVDLCADCVEYSGSRFVPCPYKRCIEDFGGHKWCHHYQGLRDDVECTASVSIPVSELRPTDLAEMEGTP